MKKTVIFFEPQSSLLEKVKESLLENEEYSCLTMSNPIEYGQTLGILKASCTISSQLEITESYSKETRKIIRLAKHKNIFLTDKLVPDKIKNKLAENGINEILKDTISEKIFPSVDSVPT